MWKHAGNLAQGSVFHNNDNEIHTIDTNFNYNSQNETLPKTVRSLPNIVRSQNQGNALSLDQIYQGISKNVNDLDTKFWDSFEEYLIKSYRKNSVRCRLLYAKQYYHVLIEENARDLLALPYNKKLQIIKSLAILSKYLGCYDRWRAIKEKYQLKWSVDDSLQVFQNLTNQESNYSSMIKWIKDTCSQIPKYYANTLIYYTLTGLRPTEVLSSINLIKKDLDNYLDKDKIILEHVKYPEIFIRKTKKAYISIVNESIIQIAKDTKEKSSYNSLRCYFKRRNIPFNFNYCRKIFATYLRNNGIGHEIIDLLQGRIPKAVFIRHYYRPDLERFDKVRGLLNNLYNQISC